MALRNAVSWCLPHVDDDVVFVAYKVYPASCKDDYAVGCEKVDASMVINLNIRAF